MITFRDYQLTCVEKNIDAINRNVKKICSILPVAAGKTEIFVEICNRYLNEHKDKKCLILSHLSVLTTQTYERFKSRKLEHKCGILQASKRPKQDCKIIISTMQSSSIEHKIDKYFKNRDEVGLIIVDECHILQTESYEKIISYFPDAIVNGWTASPFRSAHLITNYFNEIAYSISMQELIDKKYLVPPILNQIVLPEEDRSVEQRIASCLKIYKEKELGKSCVIFMDTIENSTACATAFFDHGYAAKAVTSEITGDCRDNILEDFRDGKIKILVTCNVLSAGVDLPIIQCLMMPFSTSSPTQYLQRCGRGLRLYPGKESCRIYCFGTAPSIKRGFFEKIHEKVIGICNIQDVEPENVYEELALMEENGVDKNNSEYVFTMKVVNAAKHFKSLGFTNIEDLVIKRKFPNRFMNIIDVLANHVQDSPMGTAEPVTNGQKDTLKRAGFNDKQLESLDKREASALIAGLSTMRTQALSSGEGILASGKYAGRHVRDLPYFYKMAILQKYPYSTVAKMIKQFDR